MSGALATLLAAGVGAGLIGNTALQAVAASLNLNLTMEGYDTSAPIDGQDGWESDGARTGSCALYDHHFEAVPAGIQSLAPGFGGKALRISDSVTSGCFSDQTFTSPLANEAGETAATADGKSGGVRSAFYEVEWQMISAKATEQPGLSMSFSPDRGDGARMSYIRVEDHPSGLDFIFGDYHDGDFEYTLIASGASRTAVHTIKLQMIFVDGQTGNDLVRVFFDGNLVKTGTSWELYFKENENLPTGNPTHTVDSC